LRFDTVGRRVVESVAVPAGPSGLALSADEGRLYVTCAGAESRVCVVDLSGGSAGCVEKEEIPLTQPSPKWRGHEQGEGGDSFGRDGAADGQQTGSLRYSRPEVCATFPAGHTAMGPVLGPDGKTLYVCNRFDNDVGIIDLAAGSEVERISVQREPVASAITPDGRFLLVANQLPNGRADKEYVSAVVSVIDLVEDAVVRELRLPTGSGVLKDIRVSPDGAYAVAVHQVGSFNRAAAQVNFGWMNANAMTVIDARKREVVSTLLLDQPGRGAANPWSVAWSADSATLIVTHAGTHEVSVIDFPAVLAGIRQPGRAPYGQRTKEGQGKGKGRESPVLTFLSRFEGAEPGLPFLTGARQRIKLPAADLGPRAAVVVGQTVYVANYFSGTPTLIEIWRTAPYLHDGSAATIRDVLTTRNARDQHGKTSRLSASEIEDLGAYLLSL